MLADTMPPTVAQRRRGGPEGHAEGAADETELRLQRLERLASWMDDRFTLPGGFRIGLDPVLGLVPGLGDGISAAVSLYTVLEARRLGASAGTLARMVGNVGLDFASGSIPLVGDLIDFAFKSNRRNLNLLRRHLGRETTAAGAPRGGGRGGARAYDSRRGR